MNNKPDLSDFRMSTQNQILIKTIMEMADKFELIRCGLENCDWSEAICIPTSGPEYPYFNLSGDVWIELMDLASLYITAHPQLEWLASSEKQYISDYVDIRKKKRKNIGEQSSRARPIICLNGIKSIQAKLAKITKIAYNKDEPKGSVRWHVKAVLRLGR